MGIKWEILELVNFGQNYNINDIYIIIYNYIYVDNSVSEFSIDIKIIVVGFIEIIINNGLDLFCSGDIINGYVIMKMFYIDLQNFNYYVVYLDGNGFDFIVDGSYIFSRNY